MRRHLARRQKRPECLRTSEERERSFRVGLSELTLASTLDGLRASLTLSDLEGLPTTRPFLSQVRRSVMGGVEGLKTLSLFRVAFA